jgi:hypothetical protein
MLMLVIAIEANIEKMRDEKFIKVYERVLKAKDEVEQGIKELGELGIKVNVDYLNIRRD